MNYMNVSESSDSTEEKIAWSPSQPDEDTSALSPDKQEHDLSGLKGNADGRRAYFATEEHRKAVTIKPQHWFKMDFCNGK
jgi:hypothetical protein